MAKDEEVEWRRIKSSIINNQYQLFVDAVNEAIQYFFKVTKGVEITNRNKVLFINKYKIFTVSKVYQLISRSLYKSKDFKKLFYRIIYDFILILIAIIKYIQILYIGYAKTNFYLIYIYIATNQKKLFCSKK